VLIDDTLTVAELLLKFGERLDIRHIDEYKLFAIALGEQHTSPGVHWLNPTLTLYENGVSNEQTVALRKVFICFCDSVSYVDPVQTHQVYVQCRDNITQGNQPVDLNEAISLAALDCQIMRGNYDPMKQRTENLLAIPGHTIQYYPKVAAEHKKLVGMSEINAKYRYIQQCRSLKTYGIRCFEVQQKGKDNKLEPIRIGITKDGIYRIEPKSNRIIKSNTLIELKRWAVSPKSFTMDFGDYETDYYTVVTFEGEEMSQLIGGYIDIILKKHRKETESIEHEAGLNQKDPKEC